MVVMSAAVLSRTKPLVARQFAEITRLRIEGLLSAFCKLTEHGVKDQTYIETEAVRYVYQPMENMYILLITDKQSNILEDLETLRLLAEILQNICEVTVTEELILKNAFDIIFALDEVISFGYRDEASLAQIKTYTEMDSYFENVQTLVLQRKENEEKEKRKQAVAKMDKEKAKQKKEDLKMGHRFTNNPPSIISPPPSLPTDSFVHESPSRSQELKGVAPKSGMQLGRKKPAVEMLEALKTTDPTRLQALAPEEVRKPVVNPLEEPLAVVIEEKVCGSLQVDGGGDDLDIQGTFQVTCNDEARGNMPSFKISPKDKRFKFRVHPNMCKEAYSKDFLEPKDADKALRANVAAPLLKWRLQTKDEGLLPFSISAWVGQKGGGTSVTVEVELLDPSHPIRDVNVQFTCPSDFNLQITSLGGGETNHDGVTLRWLIPFMDSSLSSAAIDFSVEADSSMILPFTIDGTAFQTICHLEVEKCEAKGSETPIPYSFVQIASYSLRVG